MEISFLLLEWHDLRVILINQVKQSINKRGCVKTQIMESCQPSIEETQRSREGAEKTQAAMPIDVQQGPEVETTDKTEADNLFTSTKRKKQSKITSNYL